MNDREKIILALENCSDPSGKCKNCPYAECERFEKSVSEYPDELIRKAVELLKEQEPRLLTIEEVKAYPTDKALWFEGKTFIPVLPDCRAEQRYENQLGVEVIDTFYDFPLWFDSYNIPYKYGWRCWSARPTEEQREAVPWET